VIYYFTSWLVNYYYFVVLNGDEKGRPLCLPKVTLFGELLLLY